MCHEGLHEPATKLQFSQRISINFNILHEKLQKEQFEVLSIHTE